MYAKVGSISNVKTELIEQIKNLQARVLAEARYMIESVEKMKRDLLGLLRKLHWEYVVSLVLLRWKKAMLH